jgi:flagellin FlaB
MEYTKDEGFTGLEAAIVLVAFIIVASVFSYVILSTGFFVTQKSQDVVYAAVAQADSALGPAGGVYSVSDPATGEIAKINFSCRLAFGTTPVDFERVSVLYSNASKMETLQKDPATFNPAGCQAGSGTWAVYQRINDIHADNQLESGESFQITTCPSNGPVNGDTVHIEVRPANGVAMDITRGISGGEGAITRLH